MILVGNKADLDHERTVSISLMFDILIDNNGAIVSAIQHSM